MITGILPFYLGEQYFRCEMKYDETKPYELTFAFRQACKDVDCSELHEEEWIVGRDLITEGLDSELWIGVGDIRLRRASHNKIEIYLNAPEGDATITVPRRVLKDFIRRTETVVRPGEESGQYDWDILDAERASW